MNICGMRYSIERVKIFIKKRQLHLSKIQYKNALNYNVLFGQRKYVAKIMQCNVHSNKLMMAG